MRNHYTFIRFKLAPFLFMAADTIMPTLTPKLQFTSQVCISDGLKHPLSTLKRYSTLLKDGALRQRAMLRRLSPSMLPPNDETVPVT